jgi:IPT/TIG domain
MKLKIRELLNKVLFFSKPQENIIKLKIIEEAKYLSIPLNTDVFVNDAFNFNTPIIKNIRPIDGIGGTTITITGTHLTGTSSVTIGGIAATSFTIVSATSVTAVTPAGSAGVKNVVLTTLGGTATSTNAFTYVGVPTISAINPNTGILAGGTSFTITGTNLSNTSSVTVGGVAATSVTVVSATSVTAVTPSGSAGLQTITLTTPGGTATASNAFTYTNISLFPTISSISPTSGVAAGGTTLGITGTNLTGTSSVTIGGVTATSLTNVSSVFVTAVTPAGATIGLKNITLTTPVGTATSVNAFTYIGLPTITSITPSFGILTGGTTITITGTNLSGTSSITIGGVAATNITNVSSTSVTAVTPAGTVGAKTISLTTPGGTGTSTFTYVTQIPKIQNYASYNPTSTSSLSASVGCISKFNSPSYVFPSWDDDISVYTAGFTFGVVKIKDFFTLSSVTTPDPNDSLSCNPINNLDFARIQVLADTRISDLWVLDTPKSRNVIAPWNAILKNTIWAARDKSQGGYTSAPNGRLQKWTLPLSYTDRLLATVVKGTTAISGVCASLTYNKFNILKSLNYSYGGQTGETISSTRLKEFKAGITGAQNLIKRPYSFNDIKTFGLSAGHTLFGNIGTAYAAVAKSYNSPSAFTLERNRLLGSLSQIDEWQSYSLLNRISFLAPSWRFQREIRENSIGFSGITPMTQPEIDAVNSDTLNNLKILLDEYKTHYPLARSNNGLAISSGGQSSPNLWRLTTSSGYPMGLCGSFGVRTSPYPLGATLDFIPARGLSANTWSPQGWTADTGMYLFDGWGMKYMLDNLMYIDGVTSIVEPVTTTSQLTADSSWNNILAEVRILFLKEIFDYVIHTEGGTERNSKIYEGIFGPPDPLDPNAIWTEESGLTGYKWYYNHHFNGTGYWNPEPDNKGYVTTNQNITPMAYRMLATMYLYPFMTTNQQRNTLLSAYNMMSEESASVLERAMMGITAPDSCGHWMEGWGYASQSMPDFIKILVATRNIGDRRLWDGKTTPDYFNKSIPGISYSSWVNNSWKWIISRIMPNNLIINSGSCNSSGWETQENIYQFTPWGIYYNAVTASETPTPGTTGSAISELHDWFQNVGGYSEDLEYFYNVKKYQERDRYNEKINPPWYYSPGDCIITWKSEHVIPRFHSDWTYGNNVDRPDGKPGYVVNNFNKPLVFGVWAKGVGVSDEKVNKDCSHISAYLGDAVLLLDNGEPRQIWEQDTKEFNFFFTRECYRAKGHNIMQLGERLDPQNPQYAPWTGITFTATGGSAFINTTSNYNVRPLKPSVTGIEAGFGFWAEGDPAWDNVSDGFLYLAGTTQIANTRGGDTAQYLSHSTNILKGSATIDGKDQYVFEPYQYQIKTCTRGITWEYSAGVGKIRIQDIVGISAFNNNPSFWTATGPYATGPETRVYYRFHTGYTGANDIAGNPGLNSWPFFSTLDTGLTFFSVSGTNDKTWQAAWTQPIPYNTMLYDGAVSRLDSVGVTMTFVGSQPIRLTKELSINHSFKYPSLTVPGVGITAPSRHYAINILLGTSGGVFHDEKNLTLNTTIDAAVKKRDEFLIFYDDDVFVEDEIKFKSVGGKKMYELAGGSEIGWNSGDWVLKKSDVIKGVTFLATTFGLTASTTNEYIFLDFETVPGTDSMIIGFTGASNSAELFGQTSANKYMSEWILGRTLGGGITFDGLRHYFPGCKFGSYGPSWYPNDVAFTDGSTALNNKIDFLANNLVTNCRSFLDAYDVYAPSVYSVTGNKKMCRWINAQNVRLYNKINSLLGTTKAIIPWTSPFYWTNSTCNAYVNQTFANGFALEYTPPGTIMLDTDFNYEQAEPLILSGAKGAIVWSHYKYRGEQMIGRSVAAPEDNLEGYQLTVPPTTLSNRDTVGHNVKNCRQWPEHTSDPSRGGTASLWSFKANWRQAISAHENYIQGRDMGITGNRWWWKEIPGSTVYTPLDWGNLDINPAPGHITGITGSNLTKKTYSDAVFRSINTLKNTYNTKDIWASTTQGLTATW